MVNRQQLQPPRTTDEYVSELTRQLRRHLPQEKAAQIAQETQAHLTDRQDDLLWQGIAPYEAEAVAIAGFGPVKRYARAAVENAYSDRFSRRFQKAGRIAVVWFLTGWLLYSAVPSHLHAIWAVHTLYSVVMNTCLLTILLSAFAARLPQTRAYTTYLAAFALVAFVVSGQCYVPSQGTPPVLVAGFPNAYPAYDGGPGLPRGDYSAQIGQLQNHPVYQEIALLKAGNAAYASDAPVPATLRRDGRYIVPNDQGWIWCLGDSDMPAFQLPTQPYRTVATRDEAARIWQATGTHWLAGKQTVRQRTEHVRQVLEHASHAGWGFNTGAATYHATWALSFLPLLLLSDFLLAHLGRAFWLLLRNRRQKHVA